VADCFQVNRIKVAFHLNRIVGVKGYEPLFAMANQPFFLKPVWVVLQVYHD
jgi:hypothetical protein